MAKAEKLEGILTVPFQLTETVRRLANEAGSFKAECFDLAGKADKVAMCLRAVCRLHGGAGAPLYTRPLHRMLQDLEKSLRKAAMLVRKCSRKGLIRRVVTITSAHDFKRVSGLLENSLADLTWFLSISAVGEHRSDVGGMPPITSSEPLLGYCWQQIGLLCRGSDYERKEAVIFLNGYAKNSEAFMKMMVEEESIPPLLRLLQDGTGDAREMAARTLGLMAKDKHAVRQMVACGIVPIAVKVLNDVSMKIQAAMAWAVSEILDSDPSQQDLFLEESVVPTLVGLLGEWLDDLEKKHPLKMQNLMASLQANKAVAASNPSQHRVGSGIPKPLSNSNGYSKADSSMSSVPNFKPAEPHRYMAGKPPDSSKGLTQRELNKRERFNADPSLKEELKAEVARALWKLAEGNSNTCRSITETKALLCLAKLMEKTSGPVQYNSVMAVMAIASVAENDGDLRRAAFKMSSPPVKDVVGQLLRLVEEGNPELQIACIRTIGYLSRMFPVSETRVVKPLVRQLEGSDEVAAEAVMALVKFVSEENFLQREHSKAIIDASGAGPLVQLLFFSKGDVRVNAVILMCNVALRSGESEALAEAEPLPALKAFAKTYQVQQQPALDSLVNQAINHLEIYHGRPPKDLSSMDTHRHEKF